MGNSTTTTTTKIFFRFSVIFFIFVYFINWQNVIHCGFMMQGKLMLSPEFSLTLIFTLELLSVLKISQTSRDRRFSFATSMYMKWCWNETKYLFSENPFPFEILFGSFACLLHIFSIFLSGILGNFKTMMLTDFFPFFGLFWGVFWEFWKFQFCGRLHNLVRASEKIRLRIKIGFVKVY